MLDLLLELIDRLVQLRTVHVSRGRELFNDHIDPIYQDMAKVIKEYRNTLYQLEDSFRAGDSTLEEIIKDLKVKRRENAPLRQKLDKYALVLSGGLRQRSEVKCVEEFAMYCFEVLNIEPFGSRGNINSSLYTSLITDLEIIEGLERCSTGRSEWDKPSKTFFSLPMIYTPQIVVDEYSKAIDKGWGMVTESYVKLRANLLRSK